MNDTILDQVVIDYYGMKWRVSAWVGKHVVLTRNDVDIPQSHQDVTHRYRNDFNKMERVR